MSKPKSTTVELFGVAWSVFLQSEATYKKMHGSDSDGVCYPHDREIYFCKSSFTPACVRHEIWHAMVASSGHTSSNLTADQMEELGAEIYAEHGPRMDLIVDQIISFFSRKHVLK